ncbi:MAG: hypothetical protein ABIP30_12580 [Ferruginibacter sp.]
MTKQNIGFKLWKRQKMQRIKMSTRTFFRDFSFSTFLNLLITCVGIFLAFKANEIGKRSYETAQTQLEMQKTDTSQQSQLNKLTEIIREIQKEQALSSNLNQKTDNLNNTSKIQSNIVTQQLFLSKRLESKIQKNDSLAQDADMLSIIETFNKLFDIQISREAIFIDRRSTNQRSEIVQTVRILLESQLNNKLILDNNYLRFVWFDFYDFTTSLEYQFKLYDAGTRSMVRNESENNQLATEFSKRFLDFLNKMLKPKNTFIQNYKKNSFEKYNKDSTFKY